MTNSLLTEVLSNLTAVASPADTDLIPVGTSNGATMKKLTFANLVSTIKSKIGLGGQYVLVGTVDVTPAVPSMKAYSSQTGIKTTFALPEGTTLCVPVQKSGGWNIMTGCSVSGNTLSTDYINIGAQEHSGGGIVTVFCFKKI